MLLPELNEQIESMEEKNQMYKKDRDDIKEKMESMKMVKKCLKFS